MCVKMRRFCRCRSEVSGCRVDLLWLQAGQRISLTEVRSRQFRWRKWCKIKGTDQIGRRLKEAKAQMRGSLWALQRRHSAVTRQKRAAAVTQMEQQPRSKQSNRETKQNQRAKSMAERGGARRREEQSSTAQSAECGRGVEKGRAKS